jgi:hypothetical protein
MTAGSEIKEVCFFPDFPEENLAYPLIQPLLHKKVEEFLKHLSSNHN